MEYVDGQPITRWAEHEGLDSGQRLALFGQVCEAVAYAQQRLVVHRDLKPSNILVKPAGEVKLLDFGIARLLGTSEDNSITRFGPRVLTPEYSAPEQFDGGTITTATDVFSLGRVLCELLTGQLALENLPGPVRKPPRDLCIIIAKATREDPGERYASAAELGADVRRYVNGLPIVGRSPSLGYRSLRFIARNKLLVAALVTVVASLAVGLVLTAWQAEKAERAARRANETTVFLVNLFAEADPDLQQGRQTTAEEILQRGAERIETDLAGEPELQAELHDTIGQIQHKRGEYEDSGRHYGKAIELREALYGPGDPSIAASVAGLGEALHWQSEYEQAEAAFERVLEIERGQSRPDQARVARALSNLASAQQRLDRKDRAEALYREALELDRQTFGPSSVAVSEDMSNLAVHLDIEGRSDEAEELHLAALDILRERHPGNHSSVALQLHNIGHHYLERDRLGEAEDYLREAVAMRQFLYQGAHPRLATSQRELGMVLMAQDRMDEARELFDQAIDTLRSYFGDVHNDVALAMNDLAVMAFLRGDLVTSQQRFSEALSVFRQLLPADHATVTTLQLSLGRIAMDLGQLDEAERIYTDVLATRRARYGDEHASVAEVWHGLASVHVRRGEWPQALDAIGTALAINRLSADEQSVTVAVAKTVMGRVLGELDRSEEALATLSEAQTSLEAQLDPGHRRIDSVRLERARMLTRIGAHDDALPLLEQVVAARREMYGDNDVRTADALGVLGVCLLGLDHEVEARLALEEAAGTLRNSLGPADFETLRVEAALARLAP
jgi:tetratricopeptide (TPR) repeat protein